MHQYGRASQVWITGFKTNEYERMIFTDQMDYGICLPDLVGYEGGQPITLRDGTKLSIGFSGSSDLEIVGKALEKVKTIL